MALEREVLVLPAERHAELVAGLDDALGDRGDDVAGAEDMSRDEAVGLDLPIT